MVDPSPLADVPRARPERWKLLRRLIGQWYEPLTAAGGVASAELAAAEARLGMSLPAALREWYELAGNRNDVWSQQDELLGPEKLYVGDGLLVFYVEDQAVVRWGIALDDFHADDPPVQVESVERSGEWIRENDTVSEFALEMFACCVKFGARPRLWAWGPGNSEAVQVIEARYPRLALPDWHWPGVGPTRFYGLRDIIIESHGERDEAYLSVTGRAEQAFRDCAARFADVGVTWDCSSDEDPPIWELV